MSYKIVIEKAKVSAADRYIANARNPNPAPFEAYLFEELEAAIRETFESAENFQKAIGAASETLYDAAMRLEIDSAKFQGFNLQGRAQSISNWAETFRKSEAAKTYKGGQ